MPQLGSAPEDIQMRSSYLQARFLLAAGVIIAILVGLVLEGDRGSTLCVGLIAFGGVVAVVAMYAARQADQRRRKRIKAEQLRTIQEMEGPKDNSKR
jgi:hypothetical protein